MTETIRRLTRQGDPNHVADSKQLFVPNTGNLEQGVENIAAVVESRPFNRIGASKVELLAWLFSGVPYSFNPPMSWLETWLRSYRDGHSGEAHHSRCCSIVRGALHIDTALF